MPPVKNDHLSTMATNLGSRGWSLYTDLTVPQKVNSRLDHDSIFSSLCFRSWFWTLRRNENYFKIDVSRRPIIMFNICGGSYDAIKRDTCSHFSAKSAKSLEVNQSTATYLMMFKALFHTLISHLLFYIPLWSTVKLGYNELGYNEHSVITNNFFSPKWSFYYINQPGYNESRL